MYSHNDREAALARADESRGNVWSGVVALALLAMFTVALVASETDSRASTQSGVTNNIVNAGQ